MRKISLQIQVSVVELPEEIQIPEERPGGGAGEQWRVAAAALPALVRGIMPGAGFASGPLLSLSRNVPLQLSGDLKDLAEIAARFDQLATQIGVDNLNERV